MSEVKAKPEYHRFLIGRGGANIRKVRDSTGARIIFPNSSDADQESITLIGKKESVEMAKAELEMLIKDLVSVKFAVHQSCKSVGAFGILGCRHCSCVLWLTRRLYHGDIFQLCLAMNVKMIEIKY